MREIRPSTGPMILYPCLFIKIPASVRHYQSPDIGHCLIGGDGYFIRIGAIQAIGPDMVHNYCEEKKCSS